MVICLFLCGCESGGVSGFPDHTSEAGQLGDLSLQVDFGPRNRVLSQATDQTVETVVLRLSLTSTGATVGAPLEVSRPAQGTVTVATFTGVPIGAVTVTAEFFNAANELLAQDSQSVTLFAGQPTSVTFSFTPTAIPTPVVFKEYVVAADVEQLFVFELNLDSGVLTQVFNQNFGTNSLPFSVDIRADGMLYVTYNLLGRLEHFQIDANTGVLTSITQLPRPVPEGGVVTPDGEFYYHCQPVLGTPGAIRAYALNEATGVPTELPASPFVIPGADRPQRLFVHPNGRFLYAAERNSGTTNGVIYAFEIDNTGALTQIGGAVTISAQRAFAFAVSPDQNTLYVTGNGPQIDGFTINQTTGVLTPVTPAFPNGVDPNLGEMVVDANLNILYVCGFTSGTIEAYNLDGTGRPTTPLTGSPFAVGTTNTLTLDRDPSGQFLVATSTGTLAVADGTVACFRIQADGTLTPVAGSPFSAGLDTFDHDIVRFQL